MKLHEALRIDLEVVNKVLVDIIVTDSDLDPASPISTSSLRLIRAGGKRLRPMMVIVGSRFGSDPDTADVVRAAALLEYLHTASLIHDDIIDGSSLRRNEPTLHKTIGINKAVYAANYMMGRAVEWVLEETQRDGSRSDSERGYDARRFASAASLIMNLCLGEYQQLNNRFNFDMSLQAYLEKTRNKTARLMGSCFMIGSQLTGTNKRTSQLLNRFGEALGMAFQIKDDVLDYQEHIHVIGKPPGADLRNGNVTLPVLYAMQSPALAAQIRQLNKDSSNEEFTAVITAIRESNAIERSLELSRSYILQAKEMIQRLNIHPHHGDLQVMLDHFIR